MIQFRHDPFNFQFDFKLYHLKADSSYTYIFQVVDSQFYNFIQL